MALTRIVQTRVTEVFIAEEPISHLAVVAFGTTGRSVKIAQSTNPELLGGVAVGTVLSGKLARVVTHGIVSGVLTGAIVSAGDRVTSFTSGRIQPLNTITPAGAISRVSGSMLLTSGLLLSGGVSGFVGVTAGALIHETLISGVDGFRGEIPTLTGTAWNTARILGKALDNIASGLGGRVLVSLGG